MASSMQVSITMILLAAVAGAGTAEATTYKVGDGAGWTFLRDYVAWAGHKVFTVGDDLLFEYAKEYHNVLEVSQEDFEACKRSAPLAVYSSGEDTIPIDTAGDHYFICGIANHCEHGQKLHIPAVKSKAVASSTPRKISARKP